MNCFIRLLVSPIATTVFSSAVHAEDYFPNVPSDRSDVCYREISVCKSARQLRDEATSRITSIEIQLSEAKEELKLVENRIAALEEDLNGQKTISDSLSFTPNVAEEKVLQQIRRLHRKQERLQEREADTRRMKVIHKRLQRAQRLRGQLLEQHAVEYVESFVKPLEDALAFERALMIALERGITTLGDQLVSVRQEELDFDVFQEGFCSSYLAMCLSPPGLLCLSDESAVKPDPVLFPEFIDQQYPAHEASVMFRVRRDCATGQALERDEVIVLDGSQCNYVCRTRLPEDCFADGTFDSYIDEQCFDSNGDLIEIEVPEVADR